jgi:replication-associated recombination protein RarA
MESNMRDFETKYEPKTFTDMVIHDPHNNIMPLLNQIVSAKSCPNLLLYGANGTGKTTLAKVLTNELACPLKSDPP